MLFQLLLITFSFSLGFFIESVVGFGGSLIAYAIAGFFIDIKQLILIALYIGTCSSIFIIATDHKSFSKKIFFQNFPICFFGTIFGVLIFTKAKSGLILSGFGILSIALSIKVIFFDNKNFPKFLHTSLILLGGISQGLFGVGGPFLANALKEKFKNKSEMRSTMAMFFVALNFIRLFQLCAENQIHYNMFEALWWIIIPVFAAIYLGFKVHLKISEVFFKKMVGVITFFAGIVFLLK